MCAGVGANLVFALVHKPTTIHCDARTRMVRAVGANLVFALVHKPVTPHCDDRTRMVRAVGANGMNLSPKYRIANNL